MNELPTQCEPFSQLAGVENGLEASHKAGWAGAKLKFATKKFPDASFCIHLLIALNRRVNSKEKITAKR